ncbi:hypothetical protein GCM10025868_34810 [Angustibacter aerolatus]|uniref:Uncharacterized protein n=1 Tax=Angustibacter aerolatus TaxID=1162965 RepID=A0ABQ6JKZ0_9ACTN|nr:hypothetical protein GCM10025868_34810 [Angustibacter aerolatus]
MNPVRRRRSGWLPPGAAPVSAGRPDHPSASDGSRLGRIGRSSLAAPDRPHQRLRHPAQRDVVEIAGVGTPVQDDGCAVEAGVEQQGGARRSQQVQVGAQVGHVIPSWPRG